MMFFTDTRWRRKLACYAPLPLRLIVGYGFMAHGYAKLMKGPDAFVAIVHAMGVPEPFFMAWPTIWLSCSVAWPCCSARSSCRSVCRWQRCCWSPR